MIAIETFGSTGSGYAHEANPCSHFMIDRHNLEGEKEKLKKVSNESKDLYRQIRSKFNQFCFTQRN